MPKLANFSTGDIVYHRLDGRKMIITGTAPNYRDKNTNLWHCRWMDDRGEYQGKVFVETELSHHKEDADNNLLT